MNDTVFLGITHLIINIRVTLLKAEESKSDLQHCSLAPARDRAMDCTRPCHDRDEHDQLRRLMNPSAQCLRLHGYEMNKYKRHPGATLRCTHAFVSVNIDKFGVIKHTLGLT